MKTKLSVQQNITSIEKILAKNKLVLDKFPDALLSNSYGFVSPTVNSTYEKVDFLHQYSVLKMVPYSEIEFIYEGVSQIIRVGSNPRSIRIAYLGWDRIMGMTKIKFSRLQINLKNNKFSNDLLKLCSVEIIKFIKANPSKTIDTKYLEPRLKELISFI